MQENLKVIEVRIENFKNIENLDMTLNGKSVYLIGDNCVGKTSVLQAIWGALSQKAMPETPLKKGKTTGSVIVVMGNDKEKYIIKRVMSDDNVNLEIQNADGFKTTQVKVLKELIGDIDFDIERFVELSKTIPGKREQIEIVKSMLDPKIINSLATMEQKKKMAAETKTENNILLKDRMGLMRSIKDLPYEKEPIDTNVLRAELRIERERERERNDIKNAIEHLDGLRSEAVAAVKRANETIKRCERQDAEFQKQLGELPEFDCSAEIEKQLTEAEGHNERYKRFRDYENATKEAEQFNDIVAKCGNTIKEIEIQIKKVISESEFPVKDLEITESGLFYKGLPFDDTALSTSELLEVGVKLAIAKNPNARILRIPQAESLGKEKLTGILDYAGKEGYQLFIEQVTDDEKLTIRIIE